MLVHPRQRNKPDIVLDLFTLVNTLSLKAFTFAKESVGKLGRHVSSLKTFAIVIREKYEQTRLPLVRAKMLCLA